VRASGLSSSSPLLASLRPASLSSFDEVVPDQWRRGTIIRFHGVTSKAWWERRAAVPDDTRSSRTGREASGLGRKLCRPRIVSSAPVHTPLHCGVLMLSRNGCQPIGSRARRATCWSSPRPTPPARYGRAAARRNRHSDAEWRGQSRCRRPALPWSMAIRPRGSQQDRR
jgi:hypothetical protein